MKCVFTKMLFYERLFNEMLSTKCFPQNAGKSLWGKERNPRLLILSVRHYFTAATT